MIASPLDGLDILVVEDHYFVATEMTRVLRQLGATVVGPVARLPPCSSIADRAIDLAVLDVQLGGGTSLSLVDEMAARGVPVVLVTGYAPGVLPARYRGIPRVEKPVERGQLADAILRLAGRTDGVAA